MLRFCAALILGSTVLVVPAFADTVLVTSTSVAYNTWFASNMTGGGNAAITGTNPDSGNGSIEFTGPANGKADFVYYFTPGTGPSLSSLSAFSYDVYRSSSSTAASKYEPALRVMVSDGVHTGSLVYEGVYNGQTVSPVNQFTTANVMSAYVWDTGTLSTNTATPGSPIYTNTIADWLALYPTLQITGFSAGIGSGWDGTFDGSVDNITYATTANGQTNSTTFNFELPAGAASPVPEPVSITLVAVGLAAGALKRRKHK